MMVQTGRRFRFCSRHMTKSTKLAPVANGSVATTRNQLTRVNKLLFAFGSDETWLPETGKLVGRKRSRKKVASDVPQLARLTSNKLPHGTHLAGALR